MQHEENIAWTNGAWEKADDELLYRLLLQYGYDWETISKSFPIRSTTAIKSHWTNTLKLQLTPEQLSLIPEIKRKQGSTTESPWTPEEVRLLTEKVKELGHQWKVIKEFFPNRSASAIQGKWGGISKQKFRGERRDNSYKPQESDTESESESLLDDSDTSSDEEEEMHLYDTDSDEETSSDSYDSNEYEYEIYSSD